MKKNILSKAVDAYTEKNKNGKSKGLAMPVKLIQPIDSYTRKIDFEKDEISRAMPGQQGTVLVKYKITAVYDTGKSCADILSIRAQGDEGNTNAE